MNFTVNIFEFLGVSSTLFLLGLYGIFVLRKNLILVLVSIELILLAVNLNFIVFSVYLDDLMGQLFALYILTVAAAESAIGLAVIVVYYRLYGIIDINAINFLKS